MVNDHAQDYFIAADRGDDNGSGSSKAPFKTIMRAMKQVTIGARIVMPAMIMSLKPSCEQ
jgi:hypothetical protein